MTFLFEPYPHVTLPVVNSQQKIPVRRIYCVGQNYAEHAKEMGGQVSHDVPFFFHKHALDIVGSDATIDYPAGTDNLHFEVELVAVIGKTLFQADEAAVRQAICGFAVGLDLTKRDMQQQLKSQSHPWALSKSFESAAVISAINPHVDWENLYQQRIVLKQNGELKQSAILGDMARSVEELVIYLSKQGKLYPGDLVFTGTPSGVGAIQRGDSLYGEITAVGEVLLRVR